MFVQVKSGYVTIVQDRSVQNRLYPVRSGYTKLVQVVYLVRLFQVNSVYIRLCYVRSSQIRLFQVRSGYDRLFPVRFDQDLLFHIVSCYVTLGQVKPGQAVVGQVNPGQAILCHVTTSCIKLGQVVRLGKVILFRPGQVLLGEDSSFQLILFLVRPGKAWFGQVRPCQVTLHQVMQG